MPDGQVRLPGAMAVDDAAITLGIPIETDAATVGGYVTEALGRLPVAGDVVTVDGYSFRVERVADRAVESVVATRVETGEEADA
jgi:CBS domain containing-hemolysin-like protein